MCSWRGPTRPLHRLFTGSCVTMSRVCRVLYGYDKTEYA
jgi:hypothetical protein